MQQLRWFDSNNFDPAWSGRAKLAASMLCSGTLAVCDIGCGQQSLRQILPHGVRYFPADLRQWSPDTETCDLNSGRYPEESLAKSDTATLLGVIEYLDNPEAVFTKLAMHCQTVIASYNPSDNGRERDPVWVNAFTKNQLLEMAASAHLEVVDQREIPNGGTIFKFSRVSPRTFHAFGVGLPKSGTTSLANMFCNYRSEHEPAAQEMLDAILVGVDDKTDFLKKRDVKLNLEMNSSHLNYFFIRELVTAIPNSRFILTIRDCYSWLDSFINHQMARPCSQKWESLRVLRFGTKENYPKEEIPFERNGLYTLRGYLHYWATHIETVIESVPSDRLLIIKTPNLQSSGDVISKFLNIPSNTICFDRGHSHLAENKFGVLDLLPSGYLNSLVKEICGHLMDKYFPSNSQQK